MSTSTNEQIPVAAKPLSPSPGILQRKCGCGNHTMAGGECGKCAKSGKTLQRATRNSEPETRNSATVPPIVNEVLRSPGQPLDAGTRVLMEPRFGQDFSHVRVHTDERAAESARSVNALAYTVGQNIVFDTGQHEPQRPENAALLMHELAHVVQQRGIKTSPTNLSVGPKDDIHEQRANQFAAAGGIGDVGKLEASSSEVGLQRQPASSRDDPKKKGEKAFGPYVLPEVVITAKRTPTVLPPPGVAEVKQKMERFSVREVTFVKVETPEEFKRRIDALNKAAADQFFEDQQRALGSVSNADPEVEKQAADAKAQETLNKQFGEAAGAFFWWTRGGGQTGEGSPIWEVIKAASVWNTAYPSQSYPFAPRVFRPTTLPIIPKTEMMRGK